MHTTLNSELIRREPVGRQVILLPTREEWVALLAVGVLDCLPLMGREVAKGWLKCYSHIEEAALGLKVSGGGWSMAPLLKLRGRYYHVHFEDVICEHCDQRCGLSATPDTVQYIGMSTAEAWAEFDPFPVLSCPHCSGLLRRRQTFWFAGRMEGSGPIDA